MLARFYHDLTRPQIVDQGAGILVCIIQYRVNGSRRKGAVIGIGGRAMAKKLLKI